MLRPWTKSLPYGRPTTRYHLAVSDAGAGRAGRQRAAGRGGPRQSDSRGRRQAQGSGCAAGAGGCQERARIWRGPRGRRVRGDRHARCAALCACAAPAADGVRRSADCPRDRCARRRVPLRPDRRVCVQGAASLSSPLACAEPAQYWGPHSKRDGVGTPAATDCKRAISATLFASSPTSTAFFRVRTAATERSLPDAYGRSGTPSSARCGC
jgi:hypothetical protein